jgi:hypothetical protein
VRLRPRRSAEPKTPITLKTPASITAVIAGMLLALGSLAACSGGATPASPNAQAKWTVMVYISGDNNLEKYVVKDLENELGLAGSNDQVQIVALADRGPGFDTSRGNWQTTKLFHVTQGMQANPDAAVADWGERNMGDKQTLIDFVSWSKDQYPADHYALYFWGHGWSWHPGWVMSDETSGDTLDYDEAKDALPALGFVDVIGYDGCNMASVEIMNLWQGHATAVTGSQEYVGWNGLEYDVFLRQLKANPEMSADQLAINSSRSTITDKTWSAVAVDDRLNALTNALDKWSIALKKGLAENRNMYDRAFAATSSYWHAPMDKDLYDMAAEMKSRVKDPNIQATSQAVLDAISGVVIDEHHAAGYGGSHGLTIYHPANSTNHDFAYYLTLDTSLQTHWDEFLRSYLR